MNLQDLVQSFATFARADHAAQADTLSTLASLLGRNDAASTFLLSLGLARMKDKAALEGFDLAMNLLTSEPAPLPGYPHSGWSAFAMATVYDRPAGAVLSLLDNPHEAVQAISRAAGISVADIRVIPAHLPTEVAFDFTPIAAHRFCRSQKRAVEIETHAVGTQSERVSYAMAAAPLLTVDAVNGWMTADQRSTRDEAVFMVLVRNSGRPEAEFQAKLCEVSRQLVQFSARYEMAHGQTSSVHSQHRVIAFGCPWTVFRNALHASQACELLNVVRSTAHVRGVPASELKVSIARVEDAVGDGFTMRAGVYHAELGVVAGLIHYDLAEPDQYVQVSRRMLGQAGCGSVEESDGVYVSSEVDFGNEYCVLVPGRGWKKAPDTFVAEPGH